MNARSRKHPPPPPEEWDFRNIPVEKLHRAISYEYARSCDWILAEFSKLHQKRVRLPRAADQKWNGLTYEEFLDKAEREAQPPSGIIEDFLEDFDDPICFELWRVSPRFPRPFLSLKPSQLGVPDEPLQIPPPVHEAPGLLILHWPPRLPPGATSGWDIEARRHHLEKLGLRRFTIQLDLRYAKTHLKECFDDWIDRLDTKGITKRKSPRGRRAAPPWFKLKELAAYRWFKAGYRYAAAYTCIDLHRENGPQGGNMLVLPIYESSGGWSDAVNRAERRIGEMFGSR